MAGSKSKLASTPAPPAAPEQTLVLDNGAYTIKAGLVRRDDTMTATPRVIPNCLARDRQRRTYIGSELAQCQDFGEMVFRRPVEKGYIVSWEAQRAIWEREFFSGGGDSGLHCDPAETRLVLTEQPNALPALQANCDQMVFEEFRFASYYRGAPGEFCSYLGGSGPGGSSASGAGPPEIALIVDAGYSFTTVMPVLQGRPLHGAVRRLDVGGKLLTNALTRLLSLRHYDMRHDTYLVNEIKERTCYVAADFAADLDQCWRGGRADPGGRRRALYRAGSGGIAREYVLPDYTTRFSGLVREWGAQGGSGGDASATEDVLVLRNERFAVPELLFHPGDAGLVHAPGLPDVVAQAVARLPVGLWPALLANIVLVGGTAALPGLAQRLQQEVQQRMPDDLAVRVTRPADPGTCTWRGAARFAAGARAGGGAASGASAVDRLAVTRQEYEEYGAGWVARKFAAGLAVD